MEAGVRRVKPETAQLISSIVAAGAGIAGVVIGLVIDRVLQRLLGKVRCHMEPIKLWIIATQEEEEIVRTLPLPEGILDEEIAEKNRA